MERSRSERQEPIPRYDERTDHKLHELNTLEADVIRTEADTSSPSGPRAQMDWSLHPSNSLGIHGLYPLPRNCLTEEGDSPDNLNFELAEYFPEMDF